MKRTPIKRYGARRKKRDNDGLVYGWFHIWVRRFPCMIGVYCQGDVVGHHVKSVGAGGQDLGNECPLCAAHHREIHDKGKTAFEFKYSVDMNKEARKYLMVWEGTNGSR